VSLACTAQTWREGKQVVAHPMPLDVMSPGMTPDAARKTAAEAVQVFLVTAADMGTLDRCSKKQAIKQVKGIGSVLLGWRWSDRL